MRGRLGHFHARNTARFCSGLEIRPDSSSSKDLAMNNGFVVQDRSQQRNNRKTADHLFSGLSLECSYVGEQG